MLDDENGPFDESDERVQPEVIPSKEFFRILIFLAVIASISGFFILLSIIAVSISNATILYPYGFVLGMLLFLGGLILLLGMIFLHQESKKTPGVVSTNTNENEPKI
ncbi:MAG: hypothetical protein JSW11_15530 [Candidatus Heimdallarchaeota archaeon]|nr:MAG: hypothetical protein JSW11_15530 [Candidatus Heimdallarchaeota archaeon]